MTNSGPDLGNGFTKIANEIIEALCHTNLSPYESRVLWCVIRKTYGWDKREDWIPLSQMVDLTGMNKSHICRAKAKLLKRNIVAQTGNKIRFNKFHTQWRELPKQATRKSLPDQAMPLPKQAISLPDQGPSKETVSKYTDSKEPLTGLEKEIVNELKRYDEMSSPVAYLGSLKKKARPQAIEKAWKEWKRGCGIESPGQFYSRCLFWEKSVGGQEAAHSK